MTVAQAYGQQQPSKPTPTPTGGATSEEKPKKVAKECKFFHTEGGCRRGGSCTFAHTLEPGERRCYCCGATTHYAKECLRKESSTSPQKDAKVQKLTKSKQTQEEPATKVVPQKGVEEVKAEGIATVLTGRDNSLPGMLEEASKMLRVINVPEDKKQKADKVQEKKRLEELRKELQSMEAGSWKPSMKMFRSTATVARIKTGLNALLGTGATHAMKDQ